MAAVLLQNDDHVALIHVFNLTSAYEIISGISRTCIICSHINIYGINMLIYKYGNALECEHVNIFEYENISLSMYKFIIMTMRKSK